MIERIVAAAAIHEGRVWHLPPPARHRHVFLAMEAEGFDVWGDEDTGFFTSADRYVDRREAARIAIASGQAEHLIAPPDLYSEDLW